MTDPASLQQRAHSILGERRFHGRRTPGPFRGALRWLGDRLHPVFAPVGRALARVANVIGDLWSHAPTRILLLGGVLVFAALLSVFAVKRRGASAVVRELHRNANVSDDPRVLERAADDAERAGDFATALRLRFRAGVIRLQIDGRIRRGRTTTTRAIGRQLKLPAFDDLGRTFDAIAYGGAPASADDARVARENWRAVLESKAS
ncbi:MAG: hypothetical protein QOK28_1268 [Actinomycetota bacterium]